MTSTNPVLTAREVVAGYNPEAMILHGASVRVYPKEVVCIIGPNGAGKSTLLKAIFGLVRISGGEVALGDTPITNLAPHKIVAQGLGYVPQVNNVFPNMTVRENLDMGAFLRSDGGVDAARARVYDIFPVLKGRENERVGRMSGGQRQMVAIGRALMLDPKVLLLDEPSAGLAPNLQDAVFEQVRAVADAGTPILLVEQNAKKALAMCDRGYVLDQGKNKYEGPGGELLSDERLGKLYLGN